LNNTKLTFLNSVNAYSKFNFSDKVFLNKNSTCTITDSNNKLRVEPISADFSRIYDIKSFDKKKFRYNDLYRSYLFKGNINDFSSLCLEESILKIIKLREDKSATLSTSNLLVNVNFLRKERLYTKLKYSRSPAYDIVSGGAAAILAGFLGFLISEKYGFELVDSGDFYFLFMYLVFLSFSVRPLLITISSNDGIRSIFSLRPVLLFFLNIFYLVARLFKNN